MLEEDGSDKKVPSKRTKSGGKQKAPDENDEN